MNIAYNYLNSVTYAVMGVLSIPVWKRGVIVLYCLLVLGVWIYCYTLLKTGSKLFVMNEKLMTLCTMDALTGTYNRRKIIEISQKQFEFSKKFKRDFSVCMLDIDYFKNVNDTYGHAVGDIVLKTLSKECQNSLRRDDSFGRWGGEEFIVVLPETNMDNAFVIAERIRLNISKLKIENEGKNISITVSVGVATLHSEESLEKLIENSDKALYNAKNSGRNKVRVG